MSARLAFVGRAMGDGSLLTWASRPEHAHCCGGSAQAFVTRHGSTRCVWCDSAYVRSLPAAAPESSPLRSGDAASSLPPVDGLAADGSRAPVAGVAAPPSGPDAAQGAVSPWAVDPTRGVAW